MRLTILLAGLGATTAMAGVLQHRQNDLPHCADGEGIVEGIWQDRMWFLNPFSVRTYRFEQAKTNTITLNSQLWW